MKEALIKMTYNSKYLQRKLVPNTVTIGSRLNYSSGRSAATNKTLLHDADLQKVRERNKEKADYGDATKEKLDNAKNLLQCWTLILSAVELVRIH